MKKNPKSLRIRVDFVRPAGDENTFEAPIKVAQKGAPTRKFSNVFQRPKRHIPGRFGGKTDDSAL
ncbi:MAG TPA: hypothetical protein VME24_04080 [Alphaproteobacteria bacterium]|nr:hypothetical protein [Alphaproteobacteria bacterium]